MAKVLGMRQGYASMHGDARGEGARVRGGGTATRKARLASGGGSSSIQVEPVSIPLLARQAYCGGDALFAIGTYFIAIIIACADLYENKLIFR